MPRYMVERHLPGITAEQLGEAAASAKRTSAEMRSEGVDVVYVRSTFVPAGEKCYCLFEAPSSEAAADAQARAGLPYERIHEAQFVTAEELP